MLIPVSIEKVESIKEFVEKTCTKNRFDQAINTLYVSDVESSIYNQKPSMKDCAKIINWIRDDILKEETDTLLESNLTTKDIMYDLSKKVVEYLKIIS